MDLPIEVINALKEPQEPTQLDLDLKKPKKPYIKETTKRILHSLGSGLRTATSIANALNLPKHQVQSNLWHMKDKGLIYGEKKKGSNEYKYHLTTDKPTLDTYDLTPKKKARKPYTKRKSVYNKAGVNTTNSFNTPTPTVTAAAPITTQLTREQREVNSKYSLAYIKGLEEEVVAKTERISRLELSLVEKEKEVWTLECEVFDKKAIITYLESKQFGGK